MPPSAALLFPLLLAQAGPPALSPAHNWALDLFTPEGFRSMTLRGDKVETLDADRIHVVDLNITVFSGDERSQVTSILLSPSATFHSKEEEASGTEGVRLIRDDAEITGTRDWRFVRAGEKLSLQGGVHVSLKATLANVLQ